MLFPVAILVGARVRVDGAVARISAWLGAISYSLYITNVPVLELINVVYRIGGIDPRQATALNLALWSAFVIATAHLFTV